MGREKRILKTITKLEGVITYQDQLQLNYRTSVYLCVLHYGYSSVLLCELARIYKGEISWNTIVVHPQTAV